MITGKCGNGFTESLPIKNNIRVVYKVSQGSGSSPFTLEKVSEHQAKGHGTKIYVDNLSNIRSTAEQAKAEIGMRFLTDPSFNVFVNGEKVELHHIPERHLSQKTVNIEGTGSIDIIVIDTLETDKTTKQHGIAWHVNGRLVGECSWKGLGFGDLIDGRRIEARRYIFIVKADFLADAVRQDWTGFDESNKYYEKAYEIVFNEVKEFVLNITKSKRKETLREVTQTYKHQLSQMAPFRRKKWENFVSIVQEECPYITERDLIKLSGVLANLELSESKYKLIKQLHALNPSQLDDLHQILKDWSVDFAIIPDGSVGAYYYPTYDEQAAELGVARLVIVELKKPGVKIGDDEKNQCWKYVSEFYRKGLVQETTTVSCFVLGNEVDPIQGRARKEMDGKVIIQPLAYSIIIERAKSRLLKLYDRVKGAPFLENVIKDEDSYPKIATQMEIVP